MEPPAWLVYPTSAVKLSFSHRNGRSELRIRGNPQGLASLAGVFLWLESFSGDYTGISISALPFVTVEGPLALSIIFTMQEEETQGSLKRVDKDSQFEWSIYDERLRDVALAVHKVATNAEYIDIFEVYLAPQSTARLLFLVDSTNRENERPGTSLTD